MRKITKSATSVLLATVMLMSVGCQNIANKSTAIEASTVDTSVEDIKVTLEERERYKNPIPDENQPYRDNSVEAMLLTSNEPVEQLAEDNSKTGDPYILRYNGKFYLYVSTDSWYCNYRVWESTDLIHYTYLGKFDLLDENGKRTEGDDGTGQGFDLECPWAPEVHYWNGEFYMYTSPHADGHKVFKSTTGLPYGDYQVVNDDLSINIDGSVFIDDNEDKWFIRSHMESAEQESWIAAMKLDTMSTLENDEEYDLVSKVGLTGVQVEGPFMIKRNGIYYLIATGETAGMPAYRLNYAYNNTGLGNELNIGSVTGNENWSTELEPTVIMNTEGEYFGYGHGALTVGPDLDSWWFPYHMSRESGGGRTLGINRIEFSGTRMTVIGQDKETFAPKAPDFYTSYYTALTDVDWQGNKSGVIARDAGYRSYTEERTQAGEGLHEVDGKLLSGKLAEDGKSVELIKTGSRFTAEYNFKEIPTDGSFKCLFGGGYVTVKGKTVELYKGNKKIAEAPMLVNGEDWNWSAYHDIIVAYEEGRITVTIDGCTKIDVEVTGLGNDAIGYEGVTGTQIGGAVFSNQAFGSSDREIEKMVEGSFYASNYYEAKEGEKATELSNKSEVYTVETTDEEDKISYGRYFDYSIYKDATAMKLAEGDRVVYKIDVAEDGLYTLESLYSANSDGSVIKVQIDKETPSCYTLKRNDYSEAIYQKEYLEALQFQKRVIDEIYLTKGLHTLTIKAVKGNYTAIEYEMNRVSETAPEYSDTLKEKGGHDYVSTWLLKDDAHYAATGAKSLVSFGGSDFTDYKVKVDIKTDAMISRSNKAGIILRMQRPTVNQRQTYGSCQGYFICLDQYGVSIERLDYNEILVEYYETPLDADTYYTLEAECVDNTITVYLDGEKIMSYTDPYGFSCGSTGLFSNQAATYFKNLEISPM